MFDEKKAEDPILKNWQRLCPRCGMMLFSSSTPEEVLRYEHKKPNT